MNQYLLLLRTEGDYCAGMTAGEHKNHVRKVSNYITQLTSAGKLKGAQPLSMNGLMLKGNKGVFKDGPFIESKEVIIGYYLVVAKNLDEAMEIAKANPLFEVTDARIEIREIKQEQGIN